MEKYQITRCEKKRVITHHVQTSGGPQKFLYGDVRGGVSWPTAANAAPSFFIIIAQSFDQIDGLGGFVELAEFQSENFSPEKFSNKMTDYCTMYSINEIYCDMSEHKTSYVDGFNTFASKIKGNLNLVQAPYAENFSYSVGILRDYWKKGILNFLKGGKLTDQLRSLSESDLNEKTLEGTLYAVNAARFAISGYHKFPVYSLSDYQPAGDYHALGPDAWMAS